MRDFFNEFYPAVTIFCKQFLITASILLHAPGLSKGLRRNKTKKGLQLQPLSFITVGFILQSQALSIV